MFQTHAARADCMACPDGQCAAPIPGDTRPKNLPAIRNVASVPTAGKPTKSNRNKFPRILLVDDDDMVREVLMEQLAEYGYEVLPAEQAATALALLDANEPVHVLITDLKMPGMDGIALIRETRQRRPRLPVILLTGYIGDAAVLAAGRETEARFSLLQKPIGGERLAGAIATLLKSAAEP
jgi:CheY-like chemotaxis protein